MRQMTLPNVPSSFINKVRTGNLTDAQEPKSAFDGYIGLNNLGRGFTKNIFTIVIDDAHGKSAIKFGGIDRWVANLRMNEKMESLDFNKSG